VGALADLRALVATALTGLAPAGDDWPVHDGPVDAVSPPCFVLVWPEPWLVPATACWYTATLDVIAIAARIDPAPGYGELEALLEAAVPAITGTGVPIVNVGGAAPLEVGGLTYLSSRVHLASPVSF
jgi:hypothetical protein